MKSVGIVLLINPPGTMSAITLGDVTSYIVMM